MNDLAVAQSSSETTDAMNAASSPPNSPTPSATAANGNSTTTANGNSTTTANGNSATTIKGTNGTTAATTTTVTSKGTTIGMFRQTTIVQWLFAFTISFNLIM